MILKHLILFLIFSATCFWSAAQNLVPNPSFENIYNEPCSYIQSTTEFASVIHEWNIPNESTSDIFSLNNPLNCSSNCSFPSGPSTGPQLPRNGDYMAGIVSLSYSSLGCIPNNTNYREYIQVKLSQPLIIGDTYYAEFYVSLAEESKWAINNLGMYFSDNIISSNDCTEFNVIPQITSNIIIDDSINWVKISGTFIANSSLEYLTIGNFNTDVNTDTLRTVNGMPYIDSYYYIDDILVKNTCLNHSFDTTICYNSTINLYSYPNNFIGWAEASDPSLIISTDTCISITPLQTTSYLVYGTCDTSSITVTVGMPPTLNLGNDTILCPDEILNLSSNVLSNNYLWSDSSTYPELLIYNSGTYWLELIENSCTFRDSINVDYYPEQIFSFDEDTAIFCPGDTINFTFNLTNANYSWSDNSTSNSISVTQTQNLGLTVEQNGCTYEDSILIYTPPTPQVNLGTDTTLCDDVSLALNAHHPYSTYLWQDGSTEATLIVKEAGTYWVNVENCFEASDTLLIETENCDCVLYLPNTFTPNQNGVNDEISAVASCPLDQFEFIIYNRWGKVVFHSNDIQDFWNGTVKNQLTNTDCFSYSLQYSFADDTYVHTKYGHINMLY